MKNKKEIEKMLEEKIMKQVKRPGGWRFNELSEDFMAIVEYAVTSNQEKKFNKLNHTNEISN